MHPTDIENLLDSMTLEEQVSLLSGHDFWSVPPIPRLNIGELRVTDGPNGARGAGSLVGGLKSACFPCGISLGATWSCDLLEEVGKALAEEVKSKGAHVLLAPTVNLHRTATNGRNFECYSEDAVLTAELAVSYIDGLQNAGIGATIKHFVGNESEIQRTTMSSEVDERTLREHYLYPFEKAVKEAGTWAVMSSYNKLNGTWTSEKPWLLTQVLRQDWGYEGVVMSDWFGSQSTQESVNAGLTLEMPGPTRDRGEKLLQAVKQGKVSNKQIRQLTREMLQMMNKAGVLTHATAREEASVDREEDRALIRRAGAEGIVLLKNEDVLPLAKNSSIAVIGPNAKTAQVMGGGSAQLNPHYTISPWQALVAEFSEEKVRYAQGCTNHRFEPLLTGTFEARYFANRQLSGEPVHRDCLADLYTFYTEEVADGKVTADNFSMLLEGGYIAPASADYRIGAIAAGFIRVYIDDALVIDAWEANWQAGHTFFEEGCDEVVHSMAMEAGKQYRIKLEFATKDYSKLGVHGFRLGIGRITTTDDINAAVDAAKQADTALVFAGRSGEWDTEGSDLPHIRLPGRQDELITAVAEANSNTVVILQTGGPIEMPWLDKVKGVLQAWYPGQEAGNAITDVITGRREPGGRLPQTFPKKLEDVPANKFGPSGYPGENGKVSYLEGAFFGYRYYDANHVDPLFPFGFGLSYTSFALTDAKIETEVDGYALSLTVENTGERRGQTVVQAYVSPPPNSSIKRALKALRVFEKVSLDVAGSQELTLRLTQRDFAYFDSKSGCWLVEPGTYRIDVGFSSRDIQLQLEVGHYEESSLPL